jgi:hypothetical protein
VSGATTLAEGVISLNPWSNATSGRIPATFPPVINNLARSFARYRVKSFKAKFATYAPTTVFGAIALGVSSDPGVATGVIPTFANVMCQNSAVTTPLWQPCDLNTEFNNAWLFTNYDGTATEEDQRQTCFCSISAAEMGMVSTGVAQLVGLLILNAEFEFDTLIDSGSTFNSALPSTVTPAASSSSSCPSSATQAPSFFPPMLKSLEPSEPEPERYVQVPSLRRM